MPSKVFKSRVRELQFLVENPTDALTLFTF